MIEVPVKVKENFVGENPKVIMCTHGHYQETSRPSYGRTYVSREFIPEKFVCACKEGHDKIQMVKNDSSERPTHNHGANTMVCEYCGNYAYASHLDLIGKDAIDDYNKAYSYRHKKASPAKKANDVLYICKHQEKANGIEGYIGHVEVRPVLQPDDTYILEKDVVINYYFSYVPGEEMVAYKVLKRSNKPVDLFEAFNINSYNSSHRQIQYEDAEDFFEFIDKNLVFAQRCGLTDVLKGFTRGYNPDAFFVLHLALVTKYPVLELLIKMKYSKLYFDILDQTIHAGSKVSIQNSVKELEKLLNNTSKGSMALKIPQYIGTYLREKSANLSEYLSWCDIYELENISKENFERILNSGYFYNCLINSGLGRMPNIMKYGYEFEKLLRYLHKATKAQTTRSWWSAYSNVQNLLGDYLEMCDLLDIVPDKTPMDLQKAHDEVQAAFRAKEDEIQDARFAEISRTVLDCVVRDVEEEKQTKMETLYEVRVPASTRDLVREGQAQHNCVGSYCRSILQGKCIIFFIRKKESPDESYITAEYRNGKMGQVMYKNNIRVTDKDMLNYCQVICNRIKRGIDNKKIPFPA